MENIYSVTLYGTPMSFPLSFALHSWIEVTKNNKTDRYDFWAYTNVPFGEKRHYYIYKNIFPDHLGTTFSPIAKANTLTGRQSGRILGKIKGQSDSAAHQLYEKIQSEAFSYPYCDSYNMILGPNCNTYTQWLINLVPDNGLVLPWNAWGKNFNVSVT